MANDGRLNFIITAKDLASKTFKDVNGEIAKMEKTSKGAKMEKTSKGAKTGLGGLISSANLGKVALFGAAAGATILVGGLIAAAKAAIAEEVNIKGLTAALQANVKGWDGNLDAIEKVIAEREKLAFADDDLRNSLKLLVASTRDVDKAFALQSVAMDLARFKGIDLATASEALIKIEGGQFRALKALIGSTKDITTTTEALAAVQRVAGGAADAYGATTVGAMESAGIAVGDVAEEIGAILLPVIRDLAITLRDDVIPAMRDVGSAVEALSDPLGGLGAIFDKSLKTSVLGAGASFVQFSNTAEKETERAARVALYMSTHVKDDLRVVGEGLDKVGDKAELSADSVRVAAQSMRDSIRAFRDGAISDAKRIIDEVYGPIEKRAELTAVRIEMAELRKVIASGKATADQKAHMVELSHQQETLVLELAGFAGSSEKQMTAAMGVLRSKWQAAGAEVRADIDASIRKLFLLRLAAQQASGALAKTYGLNAPGSGGRAAGGPVRAGGTYTVGEAGTETLHMFPGGGGLVIPHGSGGGGSSGGAVGTRIIQLVVSGKVLAQVVDDELFYRSQASPR